MNLGKVTLTVLCGKCLVRSPGRCVLGKKVPSLFLRKQRWMIVEGGRPGGGSEVHYDSDEVGGLLDWRVGREAVWTSWVHCLM